MESVQRGYRGTGMVQVYNPRILESKASVNDVPAASAPAGADGAKASQIFQNVKVLGDLSVAQFTRTMASITSWVAPEQGCVYCHNPANFAEDSKYTKVVARRMLEMTRNINTNWKQHVAASAPTGVTCYTCHRGNPVPSTVWFKASDRPYASNFIGDKSGQNTPAESVTYASLPYDPFSPFLLASENVRVSGTTALPSGNRQSIKQAEWTYGLMTMISQSLGVNCTYCHNTRSFQSWDGNPPQRAVAWHGIRMVREINNVYLGSLTDVFPAYRKGEAGDVAKVLCGTCHQGSFKPLNGFPMSKDYPELLGPGAAQGS
jgi:photosynthetic reaction center cytochrome c subunit